MDTNRNTEMKISEGISFPTEQVEYLCVKHNVKRLSFFGSVLYKSLAETNDIDILVEYESGSHKSYFDLARLQRELSAIFGGRKVDLRTPRELSRYFRDEVMNNAKVFYDAR